MALSRGADHERRAHPLAEGKKSTEAPSTRKKAKRKEKTTRKKRVKKAARRRMSLALEKSYWDQGIVRVVGVDEVGRAPLAGPVVAAAVYFSPGSRVIAGVQDSKLIPPDVREKVAERIRAQAVCGIGEVWPEEIDQLNIWHASLKAMRLAVESLQERAEQLLVDGRDTIPGIEDIPQRALVGGDAAAYSIAAASIVAKVHRDRIMMKAASNYPEYGFHSHKGYPTREHRDALRSHGPTPLHRRSFLGFLSAGEQLELPEALVGSEDLEEACKEQADKLIEESGEEETAGEEE